MSPLWSIKPVGLLAFISLALIWLAFSKQLTTIRQWVVDKAQRRPAE